MLADLPPSSSETLVIPAAAPCMIEVPTSVEPVNEILRMRGWWISASPTTEPRPGTTLKTPAGSPASVAMSARARAERGVTPAGLATTELPMARAGATFQDEDQHREVPRDDQPAHADRLAERQQGAVGVAGDRLTVDLVDGACVEVEGGGDSADLAAGGRDRLAAVAGLELGELFEIAPDEVGDPAQHIAPLPW